MIFWLINIWILCIIPISCIFNVIQGIVAGHSHYIRHCWTITPIVLPEQGVQILEQIRNTSKQGEFIFAGRGGQRIRGNTFNKRLSMICNELGIRHRSFHKIRKTYATTLLDSSVKVPEALIMQQLGHSDISTTKRFYYRNRTTPDASFELINQAVNY